jgi:alpha-L-arabinofuranosidase
VRAGDTWQVSGASVHDANTWDKPEQIVARKIESPSILDGRATLKLPPLSFTVVTTAIA